MPLSRARETTLSQIEKGRGSASGLIVERTGVRGAVTDGAASLDADVSVCFHRLVRNLRSKPDFALCSVAHGN